LHNHFQKGWEAQNASRGVPRQEKHEGSRATKAPSHRSFKQETLEDPNKFVSHEPSSFSQLSMQENTQIIALLDAISDMVWCTYLAR
jgi:hypothetical protein